MTPNKTLPPPTPCLVSKLKSYNVGAYLLENSVTQEPNWVRTSVFCIAPYLWLRFHLGIKEEQAQRALWGNAKRKFSETRVTELL